MYMKQLITPDIINKTFSNPNYTPTIKGLSTCSEGHMINVDRTMAFYN